MLLDAINIEFGTDWVPQTVLAEEASIEGLARLVDRDVPARTGAEPVVLNAGGALPPLFCVHGLYHAPALARRMDRDQPVYFLEPGVPEGQPDGEEQLVEHYAAEIRTAQPEGPYYLVGYSYGGVIAFEVGRRLLAGGERVALLALLDTYAPRFRFALSRRALCRAADLAAHDVAHLVAFVRSLLVRAAASARTRWTRARAAAFARSRSTLARAAAFARSGWTRAPATSTAVVAARDAPRAPAGAVPAFDRITVFWASEGRGRHLPRERELGWGRHAGQAVEVRPVPGTHGTMLRDPHVSYFGSELARCLADARRGGRQPVRAPDPPAASRSA